MKFLKLTGNGQLTAEQTIYVAKDNVGSFYANSKDTILTTKNLILFSVKETPEEILDMINPRPPRLGPR